jgi:hypothetical protein
MTTPLPALARLMTAEEVAEYLGMSAHYTHPEIERVRAAMENMTTGRVQ